MAGKLRVLVFESERGAAEVAVQELVAAGHDVVRCHEPGAPAFPCNGLSDDPHCPLRDGIVDVALTVRTRPRSQPAPHEDGVSCALQHHVPLVVAGSPALNPFAPWAAEVVEGTDGIVEACERAAVAPLPRHGTLAREALSAVLALHGIDPSGASVHVRRRDGRLLVAARSPVPLEQAVKALASVRMIAALRAFDHESAGIDVAYDA